MLLGLLLITLATLSPGVLAGIGTVTIASGVIIGQTTTVPPGPSGTGTVLQYLGIPFAQPPTGTLRFAPPVPPTSWSQPVMATSLPPACFQVIGTPLAVKVYNNPGNTPPPESEDCLYLNIYTPLDASPSNKKVVMVWFIGGYLLFGTGSIALYDGSSFAAFQDVIIVTFNFRNSIFGFSNSPEIPFNQQNSGFLDQRLVLQWVQDNIAQFGGDPSQVTIFGVSSGSNCIKNLLAQPPSPLPFRAAIMGSPNKAYLPVPPSIVEYFQVLASFGCLDLACIRKVQGTDIKAYETSLNIAFQPAVDKTFTNDVRPFISSGTFANVPIMMGTTSEEGRFYAAQDGLDDPATNQTLAEVVAALFPNNVTLQMQIFGLYLPLLSTLYKTAAAVYTDVFFLCPVASLVSALANKGYNVWRYYYRGVYQDLQLFPDAGAYHASDIAQVWGTYPSLDSIAPSTAEQAAVSRYMQTTWANFAKNPTAGPGWPQWPKVSDILGLSSLLDVPTSGILADIGGQNPMGMVLNSSAGIDAICPLISGATSPLGI